MSCLHININIPSILFSIPYPSAQNKAITPRNARHKLNIQTIYQMFCNSTRLNRLIYYWLESDTTVRNSGWKDHKEGQPLKGWWQTGRIALQHKDPPKHWSAARGILEASDNHASKILFNKVTSPFKKKMFLVQFIIKSIKMAFQEI